MSHSITLLLRRDVDRVEEHLLRLSVEDRSFRFAAGVMTDETIRRYVRSIPFDRDRVMAVQDERGAVIGLVHGCRFTAQGRAHVEAAFSVDTAWRGLGLAKSLMDALIVAAAEDAGDDGVTVVASCAARNLPMRCVLRHAGMTLRREEDEIQAQALILPASGIGRVASHTARLGHPATAPG